MGDYPIDTKKNAVWNSGGFFTEPSTSDFEVFKKLNLNQEFKHFSLFVLEREIFKLR